MITAESFRLDGRVALVTGAGGIIQRGGACMNLVADVSDDVSDDVAVGRMLAQTVDRFGADGFWGHVTHRPPNLAARSRMHGRAKAIARGFRQVVHVNGGSNIYCAAAGARRIAGAISRFAKAAVGPKP